MRLRYGNFWHDPGEVELSINRQTAFSQTGIPFEEEITWTIRGQLIGDTTAEVLTAIRRLEAAYSRSFFPAALVDATGRVCHALQNAGSISGVRVVQPPSFPTGSGAELTTFRNYTIVLSATYPLIVQGNGGFIYRSFRETLRTWGGLPDRRMITTVNSLPVPYVSAKRTPFRATQSGTAVGYLGYPPVPPPIFGFALLDGPDHPVESSGPTTQNGRFTDFGVSWSYSFVSATPLVGRPNAAPSG
jgi:hypothetical protein